MPSKEDNKKTAKKGVLTKRHDRGLLCFSCTEGSTTTKTTTATTAASTSTTTTRDKKREGGNSKYKPFRHELFCCTGQHFPSCLHIPDLHLQEARVSNPKLQVEALHTVKGNACHTKADQHCSDLRNKMEPERTHAWDDAALVQGLQSSEILLLHFRLFKGQVLSPCAQLCVVDG